MTPRPVARLARPEPDPRHEGPRAREGPGLRRGAAGARPRPAPGRGAQGVRALRILLTHQQKTSERVIGSGKCQELKIGERVLSVKIGPDRRVTRPHPVTGRRTSSGTCGARDPRRRSHPHAPLYILLRGSPRGYTPVLAGGAPMTT